MERLTKNVAKRQTNQKVLTSDVAQQKKQVASLVTRREKEDAYISEQEAKGVAHEDKHPLKQRGGLSRGSPVKTLYVENNDDIADPAQSPSGH